MSGFYPASVEEVETDTMREWKARRRGATRYVKLPLVWVDKLREINASGTTYHVAIEVLRRTWERRGRGTAIGLPRISGVSRNGKRAALRQLEFAGLVSVERPSDKSPIVTMIPVGSVE